MSDRNPTADLQPQKWQSRLVLLLRWFLGGFAGIGVSSLIYLDFLSSTHIVPVLLEVPFIGQYYILNYLIYSSTNFGKYSIIIPALVWGVIGLLLTSGNKKQIVSGRVLLLIYIIGGVVSYFLAALLLVIS